MRIELTSLSRGFDPSRVVTNPNPLNDKTGLFTPDGVYSETIFGRMPSSGREYACDCGTTEGRFYEGTLCSACGTAVVCRDTVFSRRGWIDLCGNKIISPLFYSYFNRVVGPTSLQRIIQQRRTLTVDGIAAAGTSSAAAPFDGMGLVAFAERWPEVLDFYEAKKKSDPKVAAYAAVIRQNPELVMTDKIPVFSHILRPALVVDKTVIFAEVNTSFNLIVSAVQSLLSYTEFERTEDVVNANLSNIQARALEIFDHILQQLSGKGGYLRGDLLGVRVNFSGRAVITPLPPGHEQDEIVVPYLTFLELYRFQLINLLSRVNNVPIGKAYEIWSRAQTEFSQTVYQMMLQLIKRSGVDGEPGLPALLNRNPTISFGSILRGRIVGVKRDMNDKTMSIHNGVLGLLAGDYDGDVLALIPLIDEDLARAFSVFDPRLMFVSRDGAVLNRSVKLGKDYAVGLSLLTEDPPVEA